MRRFEWLRVFMRGWRATMRLRVAFSRSTVLSCTVATTLALAFPGTLAASSADVAQNAVLEHLPEREHSRWENAGACLTGATSARLLLVIGGESCRPCRELGRAMRAQAGIFDEVDVVFAWRGTQSCGQAQRAAVRAGSWPATWLSPSSAFADVQETPALFLFEDGVLRWSHYGAPELSVISEALRSEGSRR